MAAITRFRIIATILLFYFVYTVPAASDCTVGEILLAGTTRFKDDIVSVMTSEVIPCNGELTEWEYWTLKSGRFRPMIVRPYARDSRRFQIVGINEIIVTSDTANQQSHYTVPKNGRFPVHTGDMIGVGIFNGTDNPQLRIVNGTGEISYLFSDATTLTTGRMFLTYSATRSFKASITAKVREVEPPVIVNTPDSQNVNTDPTLATAAVWWTPPTTSGNSGEVVTITSDYNPGDHFTIGDTLVTYKAVDVYGNKDTDSFHVVVTDTEPPVIVNTPSSQHVNTDPNSATATVWWTSPTGNDNSGEPVRLVSDYNTGDRFTIGNTLVTYTAVDVYGNTAAHSFYVIVTDSDPPVIVNTPSSQHVNTDPNSATATVLWTPPTVKDNSGKPVTLTSNYNPGDNLIIGNTTVNYKAVDVYGNTASHSFDVIVTDAEPPVIINTPSSKHVNTDSATATVWWTSPMANDNSGEPVALVSDYSPGDNFTIGDTLVTYTAVDVYGNTDTYSFHVIVTVTKQQTALWMSLGISAAVLFIIIIVGVSFYRTRKSRGPSQEARRKPTLVTDARLTGKTMSAREPEYQQSRPVPPPVYQDLISGRPASCYVYDDVSIEKHVYQEIPISTNVKGQNKENYYEIPISGENRPSTNPDEEEIYDDTSL